jgi:DNA-binding NarL/FixJ family response regulator
MPERSGLDVLPELRQRWPALKIVILTMHNDRVLADAALQMGANGYLRRRCRWTSCSARSTWWTRAGPTFRPRSLAIGTTSESTPFIPAFLSLTPRQEQILTMVSAGQSTAAIAGTLHLSESTVTFHRSNLRKKLGITTDHGLTSLPRSSGRCSGSASPAASAGPAPSAAASPGRRRLRG